MISLKKFLIRRKNCLPLVYKFKMGISSLHLEIHRGMWNEMDVLCFEVLTLFLTVLICRFAAEVFHGLQEQVASTASRSRKLGTRVQRIEASMPQLEKAILSQTSHIHFAYTPGMCVFYNCWLMVGKCF